MGNSRSIVLDRPEFDFKPDYITCHCQNYDQIQSQLHKINKQDVISIAKDPFGTYIHLKDMTYIIYNTKDYDVMIKWLNR